jgi:hypothetical protein
VVRDGSLGYTMSGESVPARPGGLIVSLYRVLGQPCAADVEPRDCPNEQLLRQARAQSEGTADPGNFRVSVTFPRQDANSRVQLVVKTGQDAQNAPGRSNLRSLLVF